MTGECCLSPDQSKKKIHLFEIELKSGECKRKSPGLLQPLPVSFVNLTGKKSNNDSFLAILSWKMEPRIKKC